MGHEPHPPQEADSPRGGFTIETPRPGGARDIIRNYAASFTSARARDLGDRTPITEEAVMKRAARNLGREDEREMAVDVRAEIERMIASEEQAQRPARPREREPGRGR